MFASGGDDPANEGKVNEPVVEDRPVFMETSKSVDSELFEASGSWTGINVFVEIVIGVGIVVVVGRVEKGPVKVG